MVASALPSLGRTPKKFETVHSTNPAVQGEFPAAQYTNQVYNDCPQCDFVPQLTQLSKRSVCPPCPPQPKRLRPGLDFRWVGVSTLTGLLWAVCPLFLRLRLPNPATEPPLIQGFGALGASPPLQILPSGGGGGVGTRPWNVALLTVGGVNRLLSTYKDPPSRCIGQLFLFLCGGGCWHQHIKGSTRQYSAWLCTVECRHCAALQVHTQQCGPNFTRLAEHERRLPFLLGWERTISCTNGTCSPVHCSHTPSDASDKLPRGLCAQPGLHLPGPNWELRLWLCTTKSSEDYIIRIFTVIEGVRDVEGAFSRWSL